MGSEVEAVIETAKAAQEVGHSTMPSWNSATRSIAKENVSRCPRCHLTDVHTFVMGEFQASTRGHPHQRGDQDYETDQDLNLHSGPLNVGLGSNPEVQRGSRNVL